MRSGLALMAYATTPVMLHLTAGVLIGFGLAGSSFTLVSARSARSCRRTCARSAFGFGTAAGSFGQFLFSPIAVGLMGSFGWQHDAVDLRCDRSADRAAGVCARVAAQTAAAGTAACSSNRIGRRCAKRFGHRSYVLLVLGFFTCGFQLFFITVHLPAYLVDRGLSAEIGAWTIGVIGLFNIVGSIVAGWLSDQMPKRYLLSAIYFIRSLAIVIFIMLPASPAQRPSSSAR